LNFTRKSIFIFIFALVIVLLKSVSKNFSAGQAGRVQFDLTGQKMTKKLAKILDSSKILQFCCRKVK
jgi:hypothetical protein